MPSPLLTVIGASAGGLQSLRPLTKGLVPDGKHAYLIAHHLAPTQPSMLVSLLAAHCPLVVCHAEDQQTIEADHIYICPPGKNMTVSHGVITLSTHEPAQLSTPSINRLFASLSADNAENVVVLVLSGTGQDGLDGVRALSEAGAVVIAQSPDEAVSPAMPEAVVEGGLADLTGNISQIVEWLNDRTKLRLALPPEKDAASGVFKQLMALISETRGVDIGRYKENTLHRQIVRRYKSLGFDSLEAYYEYVRKNSDEQSNLSRSFLISVTAFFRDTEVFNLLQKLLADALAPLRQGDSFRVWVAGCATGEEAYSIAMLIAEGLGERLDTIEVRIFASDVDQVALERARSGVYSHQALAALSAERRERWFLPHEAGGRVCKTLRDMVVFSAHDVTTQPPFIKVDMVSCRNLLIYFRPEQQADLIRTFHYSLNPGGLLVLGKSESVGLSDGIFQPVDAESKIFRRDRSNASFPLRRSGFSRGMTSNQAVFSRNQASPQRQTRVEAAQAMLAREFAPPSVLLNANLEPIHFFGRAQRFFGITEDSADFSVFALCLPPLRSEVKALCYRLIQERLEVLRGSVVDVALDAQLLRVRPCLRRVEAEGTESSMLLSFEEVITTPEHAACLASEVGGEQLLEIEQLRSELAETREHLQAVIEELETSNEELQSLNEEVQSSSEELQASNEELQSSNEELTSLNDELRTKTSEVQELNLTLNNVQSSIRLSLVVVDLAGRVVRFNMLATRIFGLVATDIGTPLSYVPCQLKMLVLDEHIQRVITDQSSVVERVHQGDYHYLMQIDPYRDHNGQIAGAILTFSDISELHKAELAKESSERRFRQVWESSVEGLLVVDVSGAIAMVNPSLARMFGYTPEELLGQAVEILVPAIFRARHAKWREDFLHRPVSRQMAAMRDISGVRKDGSEFFVEVSLSGLLTEGDYLVLATVSDITARKQAEMSLRQSETHLRLALDAAKAGTWQWNLATNANTWSENLWGLYGIEDRAVPASFDAWLSSILPDDRRQVVKAVKGAVDRRAEFEIEWRVNVGAGLAERWLLARGRPIFSKEGDVTEYLGIVIDVSQRKVLEHELHLWASVFRKAEFGLAISDSASGRFVATNDFYARQRGYRAEELLGVPLEKMVAEDYRDAWYRYMGQLECDGHVVFESMHVRKDGSRFPVLVDANLARDERGRDIKKISYVLDITEKRAVDERLRLAALVFSNSNEAIIVADADDIVLAVNPAFCAMTGFEESEVIGKPQSTILVGDSLRSGCDDIAVLSDLARTGRWQGEGFGVRKSGEHFPVSVFVNSIFNAEGALERRLTLATDITERKLAEQEISRHANFDQLTQLPNRRLFQDRLEQSLRQAERDGSIAALLFVDLDHFKDVNDTQGHEVGDLLLIEASRRIKSCVRDYDTVARFGGDEFTVLLTDIHSPEIAGRIAQNIISRLSAAFVLNDHEFFISASIGISLYPNDAEDISGLVKCADQAMYKAKNEGRHCLRFFTRGMQESIEQRSLLGNELRHAIAGQQLAVHYQPIIELASGQVHKAEALLRWRHPWLGEVSPATFIPIAEETGLINEIGDWVFEQATQQLIAWQEALGICLQMSVNKSPAQFRKTPHCSSDWLGMLERLRLSGSRIVVEITEGLLMNNDENIVRNLLMFRDAGVQVAIDDFGTGYSSLAYLKKFDIDFLKIDRSFTQNLAEDAPEYALCEAIVVMAHKLGLKVIAEGVETKEQLVLLRQIGCDFGQGFLFSPAVPAEAFERLLIESQNGGVLQP